MLITNILQKNVTPHQILSERFYRTSRLLKLSHCFPQLFRNKNNPCGFEIGAGIKIEDVGQPNILIPLNCSIDTVGVSLFFKNFGGKGTTMIYDFFANVSVSPYF